MWNARKISWFMTHDQYSFETRTILYKKSLVRANFHPACRMVNPPPPPQLSTHVFSNPNSPTKFNISHTPYPNILSSSAHPQWYHIKRVTKIAAVTANHDPIHIIHSHRTPSTPPPLHSNHPNLPRQNEPAPTSKIALNSSPLANPQ